MTSFFLGFPSTSFIQRRSVPPPCYCTGSCGSGSGMGSGCFAPPHVEPWNFTASSKFLLSPMLSKPQASPTCPRTGSSGSTSTCPTPLQELVTMLCTSLRLYCSASSCRSTSSRAELPPQHAKRCWRARRIPAHKPPQMLSQPSSSRRVKGLDWHHRTGEQPHPSASPASPGGEVLTLRVFGVRV